MSYDYEKFEELCIKKGIKPSGVSRATGISTATLSSWKGGKYTPKVDKLKKLADFFDVDLTFFTNEKPMTSYYFPPDRPVLNVVSYGDDLCEETMGNLYDISVENLKTMTKYFKFLELAKNKHITLRGDFTERIDKIDSLCLKNSKYSRREIINNMNNGALIKLERAFEDDHPYYLLVDAKTGYDIGVFPAGYTKYLADIFHHEFEKMFTNITLIINDVAEPLFSLTLTISDPIFFTKTEI